MKTKLHLGRGAAALACASAFAGSAAAVTPTAASAHAASTCANKSIKVPVEGGKPVHVTVKAIAVEGGVRCAEAYEVIAGVLSGAAPSGWKSVPAKFEAPVGLFPQEVKKGGKKIKFAIPGG